jgi:hypothetical protein
MAWRIKETQEVLNRRIAWYTAKRNFRLIAFTHVARFGVDCEASRLHCTATKIREARVSHFYATRGYTITEEQADARRFASNPQNRSCIRRQINELVDAQIARDGEPVLSDRAPPEIQMRLSFEESNQPPDFDIAECYVFKVFGPYAGQLTAFWTDEWSSYR